jgi:hypothetical protein
MQTDHAVEIYDFICIGYEKLFGTKNTVLQSYAVQQRAEAHLKAASERIRKPLDLGIAQAKISIEIMENILNGEKNSILAYRT